jgi:hypothetical protein
VRVRARVLQRRDEQRVLDAKVYNRVTGVKRSAELRLELIGDEAREHNAVEIDAGGPNLRRKFRLDGSDTDSD